MYTPHPSLVPIEMAAAGLLTVTNRFENKTAEAMRAISANLIAADRRSSRSPTPSATPCGRAGLRGGLAGSAVDWARSWPSAFDDARMDAIISALNAG